ncbi:hypothetical protein KM295_01270 [Natronomonas sp. F2-12]|jgi:hypothetical protein|uniref:Uncharacterized protein n=1 Tax=Natronomonas aquatica TaxID=2841590 RepID=A0A9R1D5Q6_9EURY|nr:hypothetical protein [Natronomonas aquatica]MCQ4332137.1 hypothetical protein [Natronomonas aquatica]
MYDPESTTFVQRIVLCCVIDLAEDDRTPVDSAAIRETARRLLENTESAPIGSVSEADVTRALNGLVGAELLEEHRSDNRSPVGKGRPTYRLGVDPDDLREKLHEDEEMAALLNYSSR